LIDQNELCHCLSSQNPSICVRFEATPKRNLKGALQTKR
jgi:hypothetical protein